MVKRTVPGNILRRAVAVALAGAMTLSLIGCGAQSKEKKAQKEFDEYCNELFVDEMGDNRADHSCQYFCAKDGETPAECSQMNALYCKIGECPLRKELRTRPA